jgi:hypothetical protein
MKKIILVSFVLIFLAMPLVSQAAYDSYTEGKGLIPCGRTYSTDSNGKTTISDPCKICHFITGIHRLISFGFYALVIVATVAIVLAGIMYIVSTGDPGAMDSSKQFIKSALIGVAVMLLAWLIITTLMNVLTAKTDLGIGKTNWYSFDCE